MCPPHCALPDMHTPASHPALMPAPRAHAAHVHPLSVQPLFRAGVLRVVRWELGERTPLFYNYDQVCGWSRAEQGRAGEGGRQGKARRGSL